MIHASGIKIWPCICVLVISLMAPDMGFCQQKQNTPKTQSRQGVVTQVDAKGSLLVIFDGSVELRFAVDRATRIQRGKDSITLNDLELDNTVTVEYYKLPFGSLKAVSITDDEVIFNF